MRWEAEEVGKDPCKKCNLLNLEEKEKNELEMFLYLVCSENK